MGLDSWFICPACGKVQGSGSGEEQSSHVQLFLSPIIQNLFNDDFWCNAMNNNIHAIRVFTAQELNQRSLCFL